MEKLPRILVVDDEERNLRLMEALITPLGYQIILAKNGEDALEKTDASNPDLILLDIMMPGMNGYEVAKKLKADEKTKIIPIVMVTALQNVEDRVKAMEAGADDFLSKPVEKIELKARIQSLLKVKAYNDHMLDYQKKLEETVKQRTRRLQQAIQQKEEAYTETILRLSRAAEYKDDDTGAHVLRMSHYAAAIANRMGLKDKTVKILQQASPMHDIGKIGIPDRILLKPGKLDDEEWKLMKRHAYFGKKILENSSAPIIRVAEVIAYTHHEKFDGSGYPRGLEGTAIPISGRIVALADVFDALTSKRPYKEAFTIEKSFNIIHESTGSHFDPKIVDAFFKIENEILSIKETYKDKSESKLFKLEGSVYQSKTADKNGNETAFVIWNEDYSVGIEDIDNQHKQILEILNTLYKQKLSNRDLKTIAKDLQTYTEKHLNFEENLMEKNSYPDLDHHCKIHNELKKETENIVGRIHKNEESISTDLFDFLKDWWVNHILFTDQEYMPFIQHL